jgi:hypothetical protein
VQPVDQLRSGPHEIITVLGHRSQGGDRLVDLHSS